MERTIKYRVNDDKRIISIKFEDNSQPINIKDPSKEGFRVTCGDSVVLEVIGCQLNYIEII